MMVDHTCYECGAPLSVRHHTERTRVGRYTVEDASQRVVVCSNGHPELDLNQLAEYQRRAAIVVLAEAETIGGAEIKLARKALGLTQERLAALLDVRQETVSRWETGQDPFGRTARLALLAIVRDPEALERLIDHNPANANETLHVAVRAA
jgi:DNA-binding transcriptional regulator YiaG